MKSYTVFRLQVFIKKNIAYKIFNFLIPRRIKNVKTMILIDTK